MTAKSESNDDPAYAGEEKRALEFVNWTIEQAIEGVPPLCSAEHLALEYLIDQSYPDDDSRVDSLINWETTKNFTAGFITGLGGLITLPVAVPASFAASIVIQARMVAAIAIIAGHDIESDRVKTFVIACLAGEACKEVAKQAGVDVSKGLSKSAIQRISKSAAEQINREIGFVLLAQGGKKGALKLVKAVPIAGGIAGGLFDAGACRVVGKQAKRVFFSSRRRSRSRS